MPLERSPELIAAHPGGLRRDCLSFMEVVAQSVANIAPSATPALIVPVVFASAGHGSWIAYAFATIALLLVTYHINQFARRSASPGALYTFVAQGLGPTWGVISGWSLVIAYLLTGCAVLCGSANYAVVLLQTVLGVNALLPLIIVVFALVGFFAWYLAYRDVELSTKFMLALEGVSVGVVVLLAAAFYIRTGRVVDPHQFSTAGLTPSGMVQGLVLAFFSFVGFESATALGHEAKDPLRSIPRSVLVTVVAVGAFFTFIAYTLVSGFEGYATSLGSSNQPMSELARIAGMPILGTLFAAGMIIGQFACAVACINAGARVIYAMSRHGLVHASVAGTHPTHATPHVAVNVSAVIVFVVPLVMALDHIGLLAAFGYLGFIATFGFLFAYILVSVAAPVWLRRRGESSATTVLMGVLSVLMLAVATVGSIVLSPATPYNYLPYIFLGVLAIGVARFAYLRVRDPGVIKDMEADLVGEFSG